MTLTFRRGAAEIQKVQEENAARAARGGSFTPFLSNLYWKDNNEDKYILFLNPIDEIPLVELITFIKTENGYPAMAIARTDPSVGERKDPFVETWDATARRLNVAIAVELEPEFTEVNGRQKATAFSVSTRSFDRKVRDEDGEDTGDVEEVVAPVIGTIIQSPDNFFNHIASYDATDAPIHLTPLKITRVGTGSGTSYRVTGYPDLDVNISGLIDNIDGVTYLTPDERAAVLEEKDDVALALGTALLEKHLEELHNEERYNKLFENHEGSMDTFGKKKGKKVEKTREARPTQRRASEATDTAESVQSDAEVEPKTRTRKPAEVTSTSPAKEKMEAMRQRAAAKRAGSEASEE